MGVQLFSDTDEATELVLIRLLREAPVWKRIAMAAGLSLTCRALALADIRRQHPTADEDEVRKRLAARVLSREDVMRVYGWDPDEQGY